MENIIEIFRVQRHDFMNHMQVISGFLQLNKADRAREYIFKISQEMASEGQITKLAFPKLAAAILIKINEAHQKAIQFKWNINTDLRKIEVPEPTLVEIIEIILSYALTQAATLTESGSVELTLLEEGQGYTIKCSWIPGNLDKLAATNKNYLEELAANYGGSIFMNDQCSPAEIAMSFPIG